MLDGVFDVAEDGMYSMELDESVSGEEGGVPATGVLATVLAGEGRTNDTFLGCFGDCSVGCL